MIMIMLLIKVHASNYFICSPQVLVFLDSHIEVNQGWLPPLIERVTMSQTSVVLPIIDIIDSDTFTYKSSPLVRGGFTWSMRFSWEPIPAQTLETQPLYIRLVGLVSTKIGKKDQHTGLGLLKVICQCLTCTVFFLLNCPLVIMDSSFDLINYWLT